MDSQNILNMAFLAQEYETQYYNMDLQTLELEISREFFETKKMEIPYLDSELTYLMKNYCSENRRTYKCDNDLCKIVRIENSCIRDIIYCLTKNIRLNDYPTSSKNHTI